MYTPMQYKMMSEFNIGDLDDMIYKNGLPISMEAQDKLIMRGEYRGTQYTKEIVCEDEICEHKNLAIICDDCYFDHRPIER